MFLSVAGATLWAQLSDPEVLLLVAKRVGKGIRQGPVLIVLCWSKQSVVPT